jgi:hypothetical protein
MNTKSSYLSQEERELGLASFIRHTQWNGIGFFLLQATIVSLMAIHFGASNLQLGYISSVFHVVGLVLLLLPRLLAGVKIVKVIHVAWLARGAVCYLYGLLFFLDGQPAVIFIMAVYTLFALMRVGGAAMIRPLQKSLARPAEMGNVVARVNLHMSISRLVSQGLSFAVLSMPVLSGLGGLVLLTVIGATANTIAATYLAKIPARETVEPRSGKSVFVVFAESMRSRERTLSLLIHWLGLGAAILFTFVIAFLRREAELPPNLVVLYSVVGAVAAIAAGVFLRPFADRVGVRPLSILSNAGLAVAGLVWAMVPAGLPVPIYLLIGFGTFFFLQLRMVLTSKLIISSIPDRSPVSYVSMTDFITAIVAFVVGLAGGGLADFVAASTLPVMHVFTLTFIAAAALAAVCTLLSFGLRRTGNKSLRETAAIFLSTKNLKAFLDAYALNVTEDEQKRETTLLSLERSATPIATDELRNRLKTPLSWEKERILRSLYAYPREELLADVLDEAQDPDSYNQRDAIFTLGAYPAQRVIPALERLLGSDDPDVVGAALKSLARVGDTKHLDLARSLVREASTSARMELDCLYALMVMDKDRGYLREIFQLAHPSRGTRFQQMVFVLCARQLGFRPPLADFYHAENVHPPDGFRDMLAEARQLQLVMESRNRLMTNYVAGTINEVWNWAREAASSAPCAGTGLDRLADAVGSHPASEQNPANTMAAVYFAYQLLLASSDGGG